MTSSVRKALVTLVSLAALVLGPRPTAEARDTKDTKDAGVEGPKVRQAPVPSNEFLWESPHPRPTPLWILLQLVPSPELVIGRSAHRFSDATRLPNGDAGPGATQSVTTDEATRSRLGLRWQLTPVLWSFGTNRHISPWRFVVVDPVARHSGSLEVSATVEYVGGEIDRLLFRPGIRTYLPIAQRGEYLSASLGTSVYGYDGLRVAYDVGLYALGGFLGLQLTYAPSHAPMTAITTLRFRVF